MAVADAKVVEGSVVPGNIPFVLVVNVLTALLNAGLFVRWISHRSRLGRDEEQLLRELPHSRSLSDFTALDDVVPVAPPLEWLGWRHFFYGFDALSRDAKVYTVFQLFCVALTGALCAWGVLVQLPVNVLTKESWRQAPSWWAWWQRLSFADTTARGIGDASPWATAAQLPTWLLMSGGMVLLYTGVRFYADKYHGGVNWAEAGTGMVEWPDAAKAQARYGSTCSSGSPPRCRLRRMQSWQQLPPSPETEDAERAMPSAPSSDLPVPAARPAMRLSWDDLAAPALLESGNDVMRSPNSEHNRLSFDRKRRQWQQSRSAGRWMPPSGERATDSATGNGDDTQTPPADSDTPFLPPRRTSWTVYVRGLPQRGFTAEQVRSLFATLYPPEAIIRVEIAYRDRQSLPKLLRMRERARRRLEYFQQYAARTGNDERASSPALPAVSSSRASFSPSLLRWLRLYDTPYRARETDAVAAYASRIQHLDEQIARASLADPNACTSCAFVTFGARDVARRCLLEFARDRGTYRRLLHALRSEYLRMSSAWVGTDPAVDEQRRPLLQSPSPDLMAAVERHRQLIQAHPLLRRLRVEPAPDAHDILWQNVGIRQSEHLARQVVLNVLFLLGLLFVSSPVSILSIVKIATAYATSTPRAEMLRQRDEVDVVNANPIWGARSSTEWPSHAALGIAFLPLNASGNASAATPDDWLAGAAPLPLDAAHSSTTHPLERVPASFTAAFFLAYLPVLLLVSINNAIPVALRLLGRFEAHPTHSSEETAILRKTAAYYFLNTVLLPSLALNTAAEIAREAYHWTAAGQEPLRALYIVQRIFRGDNAYFYCNFIIQLALTGNSLALLRPLHLLRMAWRRVRARSPLERAEAKCAPYYDFPLAYAQHIKILSIGFLFGPFVPLVWPFAWLFFVLKHVVDAYNLRYVHPKSGMDARLPNTVTHWVLAAALLSMAIVALLAWLYARPWMAAYLSLLLVTMAAACGWSGRDMGAGALQRLRGSALVRFADRFLGDTTNL
ncbi:hypothetical protein CDCA_CDCA07G2247 [Cyanidium caldarium]|uniref:CSC1/OSCA1-like cytosolic domain-containing protein n=1 Tax=Cyanidium caldarium TaxID=2771 RepID=A0AAV9IV52_CYACA|nr:hypothetical protein CDCA_CDCA07G2247 [Cyanidium caldarium]